VQRFFLLQPGDNNTFPWLAGIAAKFQQYRIRGMVFHYVPTSGYAVSGTNPALGSVMFQTSYRSNDNPPDSKVEMMNEYWACESAPADSLIHPIECSPKENPFSVHYVRNLDTPANDSPLMYDIGKTFIATQGMPANGNIVGDVWVSYEVELSKPVIRSSVSATVRDCSFYITGGTQESPFGANLSLASGQIMCTASGRTLTFPTGIVGTFLITVRLIPTTNFSYIDMSGSATRVNVEQAPSQGDGTVYNRTVAQVGSNINGAYYIMGARLSNPSVTGSITFPAWAFTGDLAATSIMVTSIE
jgi:hypothetical protein